MRRGAPMRRSVLLTILAVLLVYYVPESRAWVVDVTEPLWMKAVNWNAREEMRQVARDVARHETTHGRLPARRRGRDLACLNKGLDLLLTRTDRLRLLRRYLGTAAGRETVRAWAARVLRATRSLRDETGASRLVKNLKRLSKSS